MTEQFKPDFNAACLNWDKFWQGKNDRPLLSATIPKPGVDEVAKPPYASGADGNFTPVIDQLLRWAESHEFLYEAIPFFYLEFAADHFAALLGADLIFPDKGQGGWPVHFITDIENTDIRFQRNGKWWERTYLFAEALKQKCGDSIMVASPTLVGNLDALVAMRGANEVLLDLALNPEAVKRALGQINQAYSEILEAFSEIFNYPESGSINRHGMYSRRRINVHQCDISCMISPEMFRDFVLPSLEYEMACHDAVEYHLDGPDAIKHLEILCSIPELDIVQWVPGAGNAESADWTWLYQKIDNLGKGQIIPGNASDIISLASRLNNPKQFYHLQGATTSSEVEKVMEMFR